MLLFILSTQEDGPRHRCRILWQAASLKRLTGYLPAQPPMVLPHPLQLQYLLEFRGSLEPIEVNE